MTNFISKGFILKFDTHLHVGSGEAKDNSHKLVKRDLFTNRPIIPSSSLKGSLRAYFEFKNQSQKNRSKVITDDFVREIFGSHQNNKKLAIGKCRFLAAYLLSIPVRSNVIPYFMATSVDVLKEIKNESIKNCYLLNHDLVKEIDSIIGLFQNKEKENNPFIFTNNYGSKVTLESRVATVINQIEVPELEKIAGNNLAVFNSHDFAKLCIQLPIFVRNHLKNGLTKNLCYEEVVPRFSRFYQFILIPEEKNPTIDSFINELANNKNLFQIGAYASMGYGYYKFKTL